MRQVIFLCAFFMGSFVFACDNHLNEMVRDVKELIQAGNHSEASDLLGAIKEQYLPKDFCDSLRRNMLPDASDVRLLCDGCSAVYYNDFPVDGCYSCGCDSYSVAD